jgi:hypothetical protein
VALKGGNVFQLVIGAKKPYTNNGISVIHCLANGKLTGSHRSPMPSGSLSGAAPARSATAGPSSAMSAFKWRTRLMCAASIVRHAIRARFLQTTDGGLSCRE